MPTCEKTVLAANATPSRAPSVQVLRGHGRVREVGATADAALPCVAWQPACTSEASDVQFSVRIQLRGSGGGPGW